MFSQQSSDFGIYPPKKVASMVESKKLLAI
jgi:hypothetical protein